MCTGLGSWPHHLSSLYKLGFCVLTLSLNIITLTKSATNFLHKIKPKKLICMAVNSSTSRKFAGLGKRFVAHISSPTPSLAALLPRRSMHGSVYDKNVEDHVRPAVVPDDIIRPQSDKYWSPNPHTGVFGPATEHNLGAAGERDSESVLEQKAFFRPQEDLDKPEQA